MNRKRLAWLSFVLILLVLTGCTGGSGGISVRSELRSRVSQYEKTWNNLIEMELNHSTPQILQRIMQTKKNQSKTSWMNSVSLY